MDRGAWLDTVRGVAKSWTRPSTTTVPTVYALEVTDVCQINSVEMLWNGGLLHISAISGFGDVTWALCNHTWWDYLSHGNWQVLCMDQLFQVRTLESSRLLGWELASLLQVEPLDFEVPPSPRRYSGCKSLFHPSSLPHLAFVMIGLGWHLDLWGPALKHLVSSGFPNSIQVSLVVWGVFLRSPCWSSG